MGATAIGIIYSPWGKQSGAHINPAVTLAFARLGRIAPWDACFYVVAQFAGATLGVALSRALLGTALAHPAVGYAVTVPGSPGLAVAFAAELAISFGLMTVVLASTASRAARWTGVFCGLVVAAYIALEAPLSGMSMNPARTFGSAAVGGVWTAFWVYLVAPPLGMLLAAQVWLGRHVDGRAGCAKLHHLNDRRCIHCGDVRMAA
jgi:aquaporin Z